MYSKRNWMFETIDNIVIFNIFKFIIILTIFRSIHANHLSGNIPKEIGNLINLTGL